MFRPRFQAARCGERIGGRGVSRVARSGAVRARLGTEPLESRQLLSITGQGLVFSAAEGNAFAGEVAVFSSNDPGTPSASNFTATITWGDGNVSANVPATPDPSTAGQFDIVGKNTYASLGTVPVSVVIHDAVDASDTTLTGAANVFDPPIVITAVALQATAGSTFSGDAATFADLNPVASPAAFTAAINWGDGSPVSPGTITEDANRTFHVSGSHTYSDSGALPATVTVSDGTNVATTGFGNRTSLVSDVAGLAVNTDPNLVNPWGIAITATSPFWIADNGTGLSTIYNGAGTPSSLVVTVPAPAGQPGPSAPTGIVANTTSDFAVNGAATHFLFDTEDGTLSGWSGGGTAVVAVDRSATGAVYKGLALANSGGANFLYATNFNSGNVDVFDKTFALVNSFTDASLTAQGYAPFGIATIGGNLYVTFAKQDGEKHDDVAGAGNGFIDEFAPDGTLISKFSSGGTLNSPWGLAVAPARFGTFGGDLLVGNFGDGRVNAYNLSSGAFVGQVDTGGTTTPIAIAGLWGLSFGNGGGAGSADTLYFTAGFNGESDGLFGSLAPAPQLADAANVADAPIAVGVLPSTATAGQPTAANLIIATFTDESGAHPVANYTATITTGVTAARQPPPRASRSYPAAAIPTAFSPPRTLTPRRGVFRLASPSPRTASAVLRQLPPSGFASNLASVADAAIVATGTAVSASQGTALAAGTVLATFTDANPGSTADEFTATLDWSDGHVTAGTVSAIGGSPGQFQVSGADTFTAVGTGSVSVDIRSSGGATTTVNTTVDVFDPGLTINAVPINATVGAAFNGVVATFGDLNPLATANNFTATIDWGDGTTPSAGVVTLIGGSTTTASFQISGAHTYETAGSFPAIVVVNDARNVATTGFGNRTSLVSDVAGLAVNTDPNLVNPWGIAITATSPFWIADNGTGLSTIYNGAGTPSSLVVTVPAPAGQPGPSAPTGIVANTTSDFAVNGVATHFLFDTEDGTISGWSGGSTAVLAVDRSATGAVYKGLAMANSGGANFLYATNFNSGNVEVFDKSFALVNSFTDASLTAQGYAPFGIATIGGNLYVTFAKQDGEKHDDVAGAGNGFIDEFAPDGTLISKFSSGGTLNSPWGLAVAPARFGTFGERLAGGEFRRRPGQRVQPIERGVCGAGRHRRNDDADRDRGAVGAVVRQWRGSRQREYALLHGGLQRRERRALRQPGAGISTGGCRHRAQRAGHTNSDPNPNPNSNSNTDPDTDSRASSGRHPDHLDGSTRSWQRYRTLADRWDHCRFPTGLRRDDRARQHGPPDRPASQSGGRWAEFRSGRDDGGRIRRLESDSRHAVVGWRVPGHRVG